MLCVEVSSFCELPSTKKRIKRLDLVNDRIDFADTPTVFLCARQLLIKGFARLQALPENEDFLIGEAVVHENHLLSEHFSISQNGGGKQTESDATGGVSGGEEELEELEETVDAMRKELIRLRWKAEALETAVAVLAGLAGAFLVTAVRLLLR